MNNNFKGTKEIVNGQEVHKVYNEKTNLKIEITFEESPNSDNIRKEVEEILEDSILKK